MAKKLIIVIIAAVFIFAGCSKNDPENITVESPTTQPVETMTPTPQITLQPTVAPTPKVETFVYLNDLEMETAVETVFIDEWTFRGEQVPITMNKKVYTNGIGMYVASKDIKTDKGSITLSWSLDKNYHKITFDIGCEQSNQYDVEAKYGKFKVDILINGLEVWTSEYHDFSYVQENVELTIEEDSELIEIVLSEYKGTNGTLNVVLGDFKLYFYVE